MTPEHWTRVEELYHAARARPPGERAAFLAEACLQDAALLHDVESLLKEPVSDEKFLDGPAVDLPSQVLAGFGPPMMIGRTLGAYHLQALLGVGGMGEVYRARDSELGRDVAVKILPQAFTSHPDRLARFEREARLLAALNHRNICGIYGVGQSEDRRFLVLELVPGKTLADRLAGASRGRPPGGGGLPLEESLAIARQIAEALETAHERGIVHRDLKPANVIITPDGIVKVLDFGLAKSISGDGGAADLTHVPVTTSDGRREGAVLGTAAYMSPEQARGLPVDTRTDIWSFGCVLYEILSGRAAFAGATVPDTVARILEHEPDWGLLPAATPAPVRRLLVRCLARDAKQRLRDIGDARIEIDRRDEVLPAAATPLPQPRSRLAWLAWGAGLVLAAGLTTLAGWSLRPLTTLNPTRFTETLPPGHTLNGSRGAHILAISPDGGHLVYSGMPYGLYLRSMATAGVKVIPGTDSNEASAPVFSPDGRSIVFFAIADQSLKTIAVTGGAAQTLCHAAVTPTGISWNGDGILFGQGGDGVMGAPRDGRTCNTLIQVDNGETAHGPQMLPDRQHVLFTLASGTAPNRWDTALTVVQSLKTGERHTLLAGASDARYLPTGHIVYALGGSLYAVAFDPDTLQVSGERVPVVEGVRRAAGNFTGAAAFTISRNGTLAYVPGPASAGSALDIGVMDRDGEVQPLKLPPGPYAGPRVSPDGARLAFEVDDGKEAIIYTYALSGANSMQRLTSAGNSHFPVWASNDRIAYQSDRGGDLAVWWQPLDGPAERLTTPEAGTSHAPESWFGETLLYSATRGSDVSLWTLSQRNRPAVRFGVGSSAPTGAVFSPDDGRWVAYSVTGRGGMTLYVEPFPSAGVRHALTARASDTPKHPRWSRDGQELFYNPNVGTHGSVRVTRAPFAFGKAVAVPKRLAGGPPGTRTPYDTTPDGRLVGIITAGQEEFVRGSDTRIEIVLNWYEDLKRLVPPR